MRRLAIRLIVLAMPFAAACTPAAPSGGGAPAVQDGRTPQIGPPAVAGTDGPIGTSAIDTPTPPWSGGNAVRRSTADIMAEAARSVRVEAAQPRRFVKIRPDRRNLPENPDSPPFAQWPPRPLFDRTPAGPSAAQTLAAPNVNLASLGQDTNSLPPDTMGDIGPTQYLLGINGRIRTVAKATGLADGVLNASFNTFFASVRNGDGTSDPRVRFDRRTGRWVVAMINVALPNRYLLAMSDTATITAGTVWSYLQWTNTRTQGGMGGMPSCLGDYPSLGIDEDALYLGVNQFCGANVNALGFDSTSIYVVRESTLLTGSLNVAQFDGVAVNGGAGVYTPQGVDNFDDNTSQGYVIGVDNFFFGRLVLRRVSNPDASPSLSGNIDITVPTTTFPISVPHPGGTLPLDAIDDRLLQAVVRNGRLWTTHQMQVDDSGMAGSGGRNGVRWYKIQNLGASPSVAQSGTVFDNAVTNPASFWFGAIMPSGQGHVALGMSTAGPLTPVNGAVTGRLAGNLLGTMNGTPVVYSPNTSFSYNVQTSPDRQRWGDYSYTSVDPDDDMTLWTLQEYVDEPDSYGVRLVRLLAPPPAAIASVSPNSLIAGLTGATLTVTGTSAGGSGFFDPGAGFVRRLAASFSGTGVTVTNVAFDSPTALTLTVNTTNSDPTATNDAFSVPSGTSLNVPAPGVLANDTNPDGAGPGARTLTITNPDGQVAQRAAALTIPLTAQPLTTATNGDLTLNANGSFTYTPNAGFSGGDSFTYRASDGASFSPPATVAITVAPNQAPVFGTVPSNQTLFDAGSGASSGPLAFTITDPDGTAVSMSATSSNTAVVPAAGVVLGGSGSSRTVTINTAGATSLGTTTITLTASDGFLTATATFTVAVQSSGPPSAPRTLAAVTSRNTVQFSWQPPATPEPVLNYVLDAGFAPGTTAVSLPLGPVLGFGTAAPDGVYFVRVRAVTAAGAGPASNEVQIALGQAGPPLAPQALLATVQNTLVTLQWTENPLGPVITSYQIQAGTATGVTDIGVIPLAAATRTFSVSAPPGTYFVRLVAANASGAGAPSNEAILTPGAGVCTIPAVPSGLQASSATGLINVAWTPPSAGAIPLNFVVQAGSVSGGADRGTFTFPASVTAVGGAVPPGPYFIRVAAANACGTSAASAEVSTTVP